MKKNLIVFGLSIFIWTSCSKDSTTTPYTPSCGNTVKSYKTDVAPILQSACSGCHSTFGSYNSVYADRLSIRSMVVTGQMPRGSSLTASQKDAIACWIDNGAPNN